MHKIKPLGFEQREMCDEKGMIDAKMCPVFCVV
mgnify:CR=1 FL=1